MSQNITWLGASYSNVPAVTLPKTGGGTARFTDVTDTTATASDVAQGLYFYTSAGVRTAGTATGGSGSVIQDANGYIVLSDEGGGSSIDVEALSVTQNGTYTAPSGKAYSPVTVNVSGGGSSGNMSDPIRFFDYDGTLVASYSSVPASLPSVPTHTGLTNGTWNYTLQQVTTQFNDAGACDVGANYDTVSGATEIDIELYDGRLHPYLSLAVNGTVSVDWGDGSTPDTATGTSLTTRLSSIHHEYASEGKYTIKVAKTSGTGYSLYCASSYPLLNKQSGVSQANRVYANCVKTVRVGADCTIGNYAFIYCYSMESVSLPSSVTSIGNYAFQNCSSLTSVTIPSGVTSIGGSAFYYCYTLTSVSLPSSVTSIGNSAFSNCNNIVSVVIPYGVTTIDASAFYTTYSLTSVVISSSVISMGNNAFGYCYGVAEYHVKPTALPTLGTTVFSNIQSDCKIYVPSSKLSDYQTTSGWSSYASYMVGE